LGLSAEGLARVLRVEDGRTVRRWEAGEREIPGPVIVVMEVMMGNLASRALIDQQLEMLRSGKMRSGKSERGRMVDDSAANIDRLVEQKKNLQEAMLLLMRQPPVDGGASTQVHWYQLKRQTPKFDSSHRDSWSMPGELSPEAALFYFVKHEHVSAGLEICAEDDLSAEFVLEKRELLRSQHGASQRLSPGRLIEIFSVRRSV